MKTETHLEMRRLADWENLSPAEQILPGGWAEKVSTWNKIDSKPKKWLFFVSFRVSARKLLRGTAVA